MRAGEGLHADGEVVLGLEYAEQAWLGRAGDDLGLGSPPAHVDGVVGRVEAGVERARQRGPAEPVGAVESFPARDRGVALVEHHQRPDGGGDVTDQRVELPVVETAVAEAGVEVVLAERGGAGDLAPVLDQRQLVLRGQLRHAGKWRGGGPHGLVEGLVQCSEPAVLGSGQPERVGRPW